jgi:hypothetical protein
MFWKVVRVDGVSAVHMNEAADTDNADESGVRLQNLKGGQWIERLVADARNRRAERAEPANRRMRDEARWGHRADVDCAPMS